MIRLLENWWADTIEQQTERTIDNMVAILEADGASLRDVVKVTVQSQSDTGMFVRYNAVYARRFSKPYPVRTTVGSDLGALARDADRDGLRGLLRGKESEKESVEEEAVVFFSGVVPRARSLTSPEKNGSVRG